MKTKKIVTSQGFNLIGYEGDLIPEAIEKFGFWECGLTLLMSHYIKKGDTVMDIGANLGYDSVLSSHLVGEKGHVYSFEPVPRTYNILLENIKNNKCKNVTPFNYAAFNKHTITYITENPSKLTENVTGNILGTPFKYNDNIGGISLIKDGSEKMVGGHQIELKLIVLDDLFPKYSHFDFIKMDIEGAEPCAFEGMHNILTNNPNVTVVIEYSPNFFKSQLCHIDKMVDYFKINDYTPYIPVCTDWDSSDMKTKLSMNKLTWQKINESEDQIESIAFIKNNINISESISRYTVGDLYRNLILDQSESIFDRNIKEDYTAISENHYDL